MNQRPVSRTGKSRRYYIDGLDDPALTQRVVSACAGDDYFTSMFGDDAGSVLPYGGGGTEGFTARVSGSDETRNSQLVANALAPEDRGYASLSSAIRDFVNQTAQLLVTCGPVTYEVDLLSIADANPPEPPFAFELQLVLPGALSSRRGRPIQYVPRDLAEAIDRNGLGYLHLDPDLLVTIQLDDRTGRDVRHAVRFLRAASDQQKAEFALVEQSMHQQTPYEAMTHIEQTGEMIAAATVPLGWTVRGLYTEHRLDPYIAWRSLRFLAFKIRLRNSVVDGVNHALGLAGARLNFDAQVEVSGVPTLSEVESALDDLAAGRRSLRDLIRMGT